MRGGCRRAVLGEPRSALNLASAASSDSIIRLPGGNSIQKWETILWRRVSVERQVELDENEVAAGAGKAAWAARRENITG